MTSRQTFFIGIKRKNRAIISHSVSFGKPVISPEEYEKLTARDMSQVALTSSTFEEVLRLFEHNMAIYMDFLPFTLSLLPSLSNQIVTMRLDSFLESKAARRSELGE